MTPSSAEEFLCDLEKIDDAKENSVLIITSKDPKIFCTGIDLKFIKKNGIKSAVRIAEALLKISSRIMEMKCVTIAAINGHVIAGGLVVAMSTDYRIFVEGAKAALSEIIYGIVLPTGASEILRSKIRPQVLRDLVFGARYLTSAEALAEKVVDEVVVREKLEKRTNELVEEICKVPGLSLLIAVQRTGWLGKVLENCRKAVFDPEFVAAMKMHSGKL